jgi:hypothetical protein
MLVRSESVGRDYVSFGVALAAAVAWEKELFAAERTFGERCMSEKGPGIGHSTIENPELPKRRLAQRNPANLGAETRACFGIHEDGIGPSQERLN